MIFVQIQSEHSWFFFAENWHTVLFLAHLTRSGELLSPLSVRRLSSVRPLTFHILINSSEATGPIWTKLWWNGPWMSPFQNCVRWSRLPTKMATKLRIEKRRDEIIPHEMHFFVDSLLLVTQMIKGKQFYYKIWSRKT